MLEEKNSIKFMKGYTKLQKIIVFAFFFSFILLFIYCLGFYTPFYDITTNNGNMASSAIDGILGEGTFQSYVDIFDNYTGSLESYKDVLGVPVDANFASYPTLIFSSKLNRPIGLSNQFCVMFASTNVQTINHELFYFSISGIVISLLLFIYRAHIRKKYYITNHVVTAICSVFSLVTCITLFIEFAKYEAELNLVNYNFINAYYSSIYNKVDGKIVYIEKFSKANFDYIYLIGRIVLIIMLIATVLLILLDVFKGIIYKDFNKKENNHRVVVKDNEDNIEQKEDIVEETESLLDAETIDVIEEAQ